jgi:hypothetical protein
MEAFKKSGPSEILKKIIKCPMPAFVALFSGYVMSMFYRSFLAIVAGDLIVQFLSGVFIDHAEAAGVDAARRYATLHIAFGAVLLALAAGSGRRRPARPRSMKQHSPVRGSRSSAPPRLFSRRLGRNGERVHAGAELFGERRMDHAVAVDAALARECLGRDGDGKMRLAAFAPAGMSAMLVGIVVHAESFRGEHRLQLAFDAIGHPHAVRLPYDFKMTARLPTLLGNRPDTGRLACASGS